MTQEEKDLVLKDIGARLYYGVKISVPVVEKDMIFTVVGISESWLLVKNDRGSIFNINTVLEFKPYYRPMSSMTEEEKEKLLAKLPKKWNIEIDKFGDLYFDICEQCMSDIELFTDIINWLNKKMFDYHGFIPKDSLLKHQKGCIIYNF